MKEKVELIFNDDGLIFINFWDFLNADDVNCKLFLMGYDDDGNRLELKEIKIELDNE